MVARCTSWSDTQSRLSCRKLRKYLLPQVPGCSSAGAGMHQSRGSFYIQFFLANFKGWTWNRVAGVYMENVPETWSCDVSIRRVSCIWIVCQNFIISDIASTWGRDCGGKESFGWMFLRNCAFCHVSFQQWWGTNRARFVSNCFMYRFENRTIKRNCCWLHGLAAICS